MRHMCKQCGEPTGREPEATYCFPCTRVRASRRLAEPGRVRAGDYKPVAAGDVWVCKDCARPLKQYAYDGKKRRPPLRCIECTIKRYRYLSIESGASAAHAAAARAQKNGLLPRPSSLACVDCNRQAECYDHRDYSKPLQVDPVCRSCNVMRGPAIPAPHTQSPVQEAA